MIRDELDTMVKQLTDELGVPATATLVLPVKKENAAATWLGAPVVMLTEGLVDKCPVWQTQAIIAHELAHLKLGHPWQIGALRALLVVIGAVGVWSQAWLALAPCVGLMLLVYAMYCRSTELVADELAAKAIGTPMPLIAWLQSRKPHTFTLSHPSPARRIKNLALHAIIEDTTCTLGSLTA